RPTRPGAASLPPVAVAAFDPQTEQYVTKVTPSIALRVVDVPAFNAATVEYQPPPSGEKRRWLPPSAVWATAAVGVTLSLVAVLTQAALVIHKRFQINPAWWLRRHASSLRCWPEPARTARQITDTLADYLERATGRPQGALTPDEASRAVAALTHDADLAMRTTRLIADCDRACYSQSDGAPSSRALIACARALFDEIGRKSNKPSEQGGRGAPPRPSPVAGEGGSWPARPGHTARAGKG